MKRECVLWVCLWSVVPTQVRHSLPAGTSTPPPFAPCQYSSAGRIANTARRTMSGLPKTRGSALPSAPKARPRVNRKLHSKQRYARSPLGCTRYLERWDWIENCSFFNFQLNGLFTHTGFNILKLISCEHARTPKEFPCRMELARRNL